MTRQGELFAQHDQIGDDSLHVFRGIRFHRTRLHSLQGPDSAYTYIKDVLQAMLVPELSTYRLQVFQRDNARAYTARAMWSLLQQQQDVNVRDWPAFP